MPTLENAAQEWAYWETAPAPHAARSFPSLDDGIRPDYAAPEHLADLAASFALTGGHLSETWQFGDAPDKAATAQRIRTWRTLWRLGVIRPVSTRGAWIFALTDRDTIAADAQQMTTEDRAKAVAYGEAVHTHPGRAAVLAVSARIYADRIAALQREQRRALAALGHQTQPAEVLSLRDYRRQRDALRAPGRRHTVRQTQPQDEAEAIAL